ncbi:MAG: M23 family metallopeptidase [Myxococcota bacterium]
MFLLLVAATAADAVLDNPGAALPAYGADVAPLFVWPLSGSASPDWITGGFTPRWKVSDARYDFHQGLDLVPRVGDAMMAQADIVARPPAVRAVADGVVAAIYPVGSDGFSESGNVVRIKHFLSGSADTASNTYHTYYMHLSDTTVRVGKRVRQGQTIGHLGNTRSLDRDLDFWHLHFEVRGAPHLMNAMNPLRYLAREELDGYAPEIVPASELPGSCAGVEDPADPVFAVRYRADRDEIDVSQVVVTLTDLDTGAVHVETVDYERRAGITWWEDRDGDGYATPAGTYGETGVEYDPDALLGVVEPVFDACGDLRNVFGSTSDELQVELLFSGLPGGGAVRIEAEVCDLFGVCEAAGAVTY